MMTDNLEHISLDDVAFDRRMFAQAHTHLKARARLEWLFGGLVFSTVFGFLAWFFRPTSPLAVYVSIAIISFLVSGVVVYMSLKQMARWYKSKEAELDSVENRIRAGENVPRPNPSINPDAAR